MPPFPSIQCKFYIQHFYIITNNNIQSGHPVYGLHIKYFYSNEFIDIYKNIYI